tara:strand:- start:5868 stop:6896 length:1029 start_codon:yes stop_codon:yes gene_type:complete
MDQGIFISIVTPTFNRADELDLLLQSLSQQTVKMDLFESIISDDGSTDITKEIVEKWQKKSKFKIRYLSQKNKGPGEARNHGLKESNGDLILFIDSDCEAHPDWIKTILNQYNTNSFDAFGGPDGAKDDFTLLQKAIDYSMTSLLTTGGIRGHSEKMISKFYPRTHNMGITKDIYRKIGGFGTLRHGQDIEYSNRIIKSGAKVKFLKDALVYHRRRSTIKQFSKQVFNWGVARVNLGKIDLSMLRLVHFLPTIACLISLVIIFLMAYSGISIHNILFFFMIPLFIIAFLGSFKKRDIRIIPYLLAVIPIQVIAYGIGFFQAFIRRFVFQESEIIGFSKRYYK